MKLLTKTNRQYIIFSAIAYVLIAVIFYLVTEYVVYEEVEYRLKVERQDFEHYVAEQGMWESSCYFVEDKIDLTVVADTLPHVEMFKDTVITTRYTGQADPFRQYSFYTVINSQPYLVNIRKSLIESKKLLTFITATMLILLSAGLTILFFLQRKESQRIWQPFYNTLRQAKAFNLNAGGGLTMPPSTIAEFEELNRVLEKMTAKIAVDYQNLKEFTENAAHEIQTPLALILSRVEELIQGKNFNDKQMYWLEEIHRSTIRLSKLHQGLLLLSKIENGQFHDQERMNVTGLMRKKAEESDEYLALKSLTMEWDLQSDFSLDMHPVLADVLISNLLNNAIRHNVNGGRIWISSSGQSLTISNMGHDIDFDTDKLFGRFKKQNQSSDSLGLGLAIVHKICEYYNIKIRYEVDEAIHRFVLDNEASSNKSSTNK